MFPVSWECPHNIVKYTDERLLKISDVSLLVEKAHKWFR